MSLNLLEFEEEEEHEVASFIPVGVVRPYQFEPIIAAGPNPTTARAHDSDHSSNEDSDDDDDGEIVERYPLPQYRSERIGNTDWWA